MQLYDMDKLEKIREGIETEKLIHINTYIKLLSYYAEKKNLPSIDLFFGWLSEDKIKEKK
jgi:hypothetical protein